MSLLPLWIGLACVVDDDAGDATDSAALEATPADSADTSRTDADTQAPATGPVYEIERVHQATMPTARGPSLVAASRTSGTVLLLEGSGEVVRILSDLYVGPSGDYCLDGGSGSTCEGGTLWTSDRIEPHRDLSHLCFDDQGGRLFLVNAAGDNVEVVDTDPAGDDAYTYLRSHEVIAVPDELTETTWSGPCHYDASRDALLLTSPDGTVGALVHTTTDELLDTVELPGVPKRLWSLDSGDVALLAHEGLYRLSGHDYQVQATIDEIGISAAAIDRGTGEALYAHGDGTLLSGAGLLDDEPAPRSVQTTGAVRSVAVDETTELAWVAIDEDDGLLLYLVQDEALTDAVGIEGTFQAMGLAASGGDLVVTSRVGDEVEVGVFDARPEVADELPSLRAFAVTTLEAPSDSNLDMPCEGKDNEGFDALLRAVEGNAAVLAEAGLPVAVAVGPNFAATAERCDRVDVFRSLDELGFDLGVLATQRPCYHCTNDELEDDEPDTCEPSSPYFCDADGGDCCFPADPEYCGLGDQACYLRHLGKHVPGIDALLPGGADFLAGADRAAGWDWGWREAVTDLERADGTVGYDLVLMARAWAYGDEVAPGDPRGAGPAPWHAADAAQAWALGTEGDWAEPAATAEVLYLPGLAVTVPRLSEWQSSGLFMGDYLAVSPSPTYASADFAVLTQHLRRSLNHRTDVEPNTWHLQVPDLATVGFADYQGERTGAEDELFEWVDAIDARYSDELTWQVPSAIRAAFPAD